MAGVKTELEVIVIGISASEERDGAIEKLFTSQFVGCRLHLFPLLNRADDGYFRKDTLTLRARTVLDALVRRRASQVLGILGELSEARNPPVVMVGCGIGGTLVKQFFLDTPHWVNPVSEWETVVRGLLGGYGGHDAPARDVEDISDDFEHVAATYATIKLSSHAGPGTQHPYFSAVPRDDFSENVGVHHHSDSVQHHSGSTASLAELGGDYSRVVLEKEVFPRIEKWLVRVSTRGSSNLYTSLLRTLVQRDAVSHHLQHRRHAPPTHEWMAGNATLQDWKDSDKSGLLILHGKPGSGSTVACLPILDDLRARPWDSQESPGVMACFSFDRRDARRLTEKTLLKSLVRQILAAKPALFDNIQHLCRLFSKHPSPSKAELWTLLRALLTYPAEFPIVCIIKGLDQCDDPPHLLSSAHDANERESRAEKAEEQTDGPAAAQDGETSRARHHPWELLVERFASIARLCDSRPRPLKILITSSLAPRKEEKDIPATGYGSISLSDQEGLHKITESLWRTNVARLVQKLAIWKTVEARLISKFPKPAPSYLDMLLQTARLQRHTRCMTKAKAESLLAAVDFSTEGSIRDLFACIVSPTGTSHREAAIHTLNWIFYARRPLSMSEISVAIALGGNVATLQELDLSLSWTTAQDLQDWFGPLIKVLHDEVHLLHGEVWEFARDSLWGTCIKEDFEATATRQCLKYIAMVANKTPRAGDGPHAEADYRVLAFSDYALQFWPAHYRQAGANHQQQGDLRGDVVSFLSDPAIQPVLRDACGLFDGRADLFAATDELHFAQLVASKHNLDDVLIELIRLRGPPPLAADSESLPQPPAEEPSPALQTAFEMACREGSTRVAEAFLVRGVRSDAAIRLACEGGRVPILNLFLRYCPPSNDELLSSLVQASASRGHVDILQLLLGLPGMPREHVINSEDESGATALHMAAQTGQRDAVVTLIGAGAEATRCTRDTKLNCLQLAAECGFSDVVSEFLKHMGPDEASGETLPALHLASRYGHLQAVMVLIKAGADVRRRALGSTPLHLASKHGCLSVVKWLIRGRDGDGDGGDGAVGEMISVTNSDGDNALHLAVKEGHVLVFRELMAVAKLNHEILEGTNQAGLSPLSAAAVQGNVEIVAEYGRGEPSLSFPVSALIAVAKMGNETMVDYLLKAGWSCDGTDAAGRSPVHWAAANNHYNALQVLLDNKGPGLAVQDQEGDTALHVAIKEKSLGAAELLLNRCPTTANMKNLQDKTPLYLAVEDNNQVAVSLLLDHAKDSIDVNVACARGWTALHAASECPEIAELLLGHKANPNQRNDRGSTPLVLAAESGEEAVIKILLHRGGADPTLPNDNMSTALHRASQNGHLSSVEALVEAGAVIDAQKKDGSTPLYWAVVNSRTDVVRWLLEHGALTNVYGGEYHSCLQMAAWVGDVEIARLLLDSKSTDVNAAGGRFRSALWAAIEDDNADMIRLLLENGADPTRMDDEGTTCLHRCVQGRRHGTLSWELPLQDILDLFVDKASNFDINTRDAAGRTALHSCVIEPRDDDVMTIAELVKTTKCLLDRRADPSLLDRQDRTAADYAVLIGNAEELVELLIQDECLLAQDVRGHGLLHRAASEGHEGMVRLLLGKVRRLGEKGAPLIQDGIHGAVGSNKLELVKLLCGDDHTELDTADGSPEAQCDETGIAARPNINSLDCNGWTPLLAAKQYRCADIVEYLESLGGVEPDQRTLNKNRPSRWHPRDCHHSLAVRDPPGTTVKVMATVAGTDTPCAVVRADRCVPGDGKPYYFEVDIKKASSGDGTIGIGFCREHVPLDTMLGLAKGSWAYHSDDGQVFPNSGETGRESPSLDRETHSFDRQPFGEGDVVGCCIDVKAGRCFFTINGKNIGVAWEDPESIKGQLYPAIFLDRRQEMEISARFDSRKKEKFVYSGLDELQTLATSSA
ncbi:ankyrin repeat-containing domain protein [Chaetomidium leptoderma]|uniref:Ankyrin repeat-containing domain protein n=1 Tax=Chaetomidium leptoderma TaxID=669021 RepID=A0AAN6ZW61_9PEZI|nr:ankyrin repeat-containing domain protein [Chaetomidium leptoderma]